MTRHQEGATLATPGTTRAAVGIVGAATPTAEAGAAHALDAHGSTLPAMIGALIAIVQVQNDHALGAPRLDQDLLLDDVTMHATSHGAAVLRSAAWLAGTASLHAQEQLQPVCSGARHVVPGKYVSLHEA